MINDRHKEIRRENQYRPVEPRWRHTYDRERMFVYLNRSAHNAAVLLEMVVPIRVTEHDIGSAVGAVLIGCVDKPSKIRLNAQCVEVVSANLKGPRQGWILAGVQPRLSDVVSYQTVEA